MIPFFLSKNLWEKLEEVTPESWDEFSDLFSRQVVAAKPVKPKSESKPVKQQAVKSIVRFPSFFYSIIISNLWFCYSFG